MTDTTRTPTTDAFALLPAATQQALERVKAANPHGLLPVRNRQMPQAWPTISANAVKKRRRKPERKTRSGVSCSVKTRAQ